MEIESGSPERSTSSLSGNKVLFGVTKSNWGGAQTYVAMMAQAAKEAGADVAVMAGAATGRAGESFGLLFDVLGDSGIRTIPLSIERDIGMVSEWHAFKELLKIIREEKPDVLHLNSSKMAALGALAGRIVGTKHIICTIHGWPHKEQRPFFWKLMAWAGSWLTVNLSHKTIVVSERDLADSPTLFFRDSLVLIHNGIPDFTRLSREDARSELTLHAPDLSSYTHWLLMNAELHPNKGISTAIRALAELVPHHKELALVVCGEGQQRDALIELAISLQIPARVFFLGFIPDARQYLNAGDIYLLPSRKEGLPLALLEAGLAGLPVVASKVGGIPEVITDQKDGLYTPRSNTHILARAIAYLLNHPEKAKAFGLALRETVLTDFSDADMIEKTLALYAR